MESKKNANYLLDLSGFFMASCPHIPGLVVHVVSRALSASENCSLTLATFAATWLALCCSDSPLMGSNAPIGQSPQRTGGILILRREQRVVVPGAIGYESTRETKGDQGSPSHFDGLCVSLRGKHALVYT
jgi:hypothetical protein